MSEKSGRRSPTPTQTRRAGQPVWCAAAKDEVSEAIAKLFGGYGQQYQAVLAKAATFHDEFTRALGGAGNTYAATPRRPTRL